MALAIFQQITGINTIIYYAPTLLAQAGFGNSALLLANVGNGVVNVGMTVVAISRQPAHLADHDSINRDRWRVVLPDGRLRLPAAITAQIARGAALHHTVDGLDVAAVTAHRHDQRTACLGTDTLASCRPSPARW